MGEKPKQERFFVRNRSEYIENGEYIWYNTIKGISLTLNNVNAWISLVMCVIIKTITTNKWIGCFNLLNEELMISHNNGMQKKLYVFKKGYLYGSNNNVTVIEISRICNFINQIINRHNLAAWIDLEIWTLIVRFQGLFICENAGYFW